MYIVIGYFVYLVVSLSTTVWLVQTPQKNGRSFLIDAFHGNTGLADSVNRLLVVGFYLINAGYVTRALRSATEAVTSRQAIELVSDKFGLVPVVLGTMHFFNLYIFNRRRTRGQSDWSPPFPPDSRIRAPAES